jgi:hypothetical protein
MRFRLEAGLAFLSASAALGTVVWPDWIELAFHWDPDNGSGSLEWLIVTVAVMMGVTSSILAVLEWRKAGHA